jgi:hypothetical protein
MALNSDMRHRKTMSYHVITRNKSSPVGGAARDLSPSGSSDDGAEPCTGHWWLR